MGAGCDVYIQFTPSLVCIIQCECTNKDYSRITLNQRTDIIDFIPNVSWSRMWLVMVSFVGCEKDECPM